MATVVPHRSVRSIAGVAGWKWLALLLALVLLIVALLSSGSSAQTVASVDGKPITLATYRHWLTAAAVSAHDTDAAAPPFVPDAPGYSRCIAFERNATKSETTKPTTAALREACQALRISLAESVIQLLVSGQWYMGQGAREGITLSAAAIQTGMRTATPKTTTQLHLLNSEGLDHADLEFEVRASLYAQRLDTLHGGPTPTITAAQIAAYYKANKSQIGNETLAKATPAIRQLLVEEAQAPKLDTYLATVQRYWRPRTSCAPGYRIASYCRVT